MCFFSEGFISGKRNFKPPITLCRPAPVKAGSRFDTTRLVTILYFAVLISFVTNLSNILQKSTYNGTYLIHFPWHHIPRIPYPSILLSSIQPKLCPIWAWIPVFADALSKMLLKLTSPFTLTTQLASCIDSVKAWKLGWTYPRMNLKQENAALFPTSGDMT